MHPLSNDNIIAAKQGDTEARERILRLCYRYARKGAHNYHIPHEQNEDACQVAVMTANRAIDLYDPERGFSGGNYVYNALIAGLMQYWTFVNREKNKFYAKSSRLNEPIMGEEELSYLDVIKSNTDVASEAVWNVYRDYLLNKIKAVLTDMELQVFKLRVEGFAPRDICRMLDITSKSEDNAWQRASQKVITTVFKRKVERRGKITQETISAVKKDLASGVSKAEISRRHSISTASVGIIAKKEILN